MFLIKPRSLRLVLLLVFVSPLAAHALHDSEKPLIFGFLPSRSSVALFKQYTPLRDYLTQQLGHTIILETAADYSSFLQDTNNRKYDFVLTAPHFALLAIDSGKYEAPVTYTKALMADILVAKDGPITDLSQLAGKKIALPPESAIISMAGRHFLNLHGLTKATGVTYVYSNSHNAGIHAMLAGDVSATVVSTNITLQFLKKNAPIRRLATTKALPGMAFLVARDLPDKLRRAYGHALTQMDDTQAGKAALAKMGYPGYREARPQEFESARPYLQIYNNSQKAKR